MAGDESLNHFSVPSERSQSTKTRAIVTHEGKNNGEGSWKCSRHGGVITCFHIEQARHALIKFVTRDPDAPPLAALEENTHPNANKGAPFLVSGAVLCAKTKISTPCPLCWYPDPTDIPPANITPSLGNTSNGHTDLPTSEASFGTTPHIAP